MTAQVFTQNIFPFTKNLYQSTEIFTKDPLTKDEFALLLGFTTQNMTYHLQKSKLKPYLDDGSIIIEDGEYRIPRELLNLFSAKEGGLLYAKRMQDASENFAQASENLSKVLTTKPENIAQNSVQTDEKVLENLRQVFEERIKDKDQIIENLRKDIQVLPDRLESFYTGRLNDKEAVISAQASMIKELTIEVANLRADKERLNNQLSSSHTAIQKFKSHEELMQEIAEGLKSIEKKSGFRWPWQK